MSNKQDFKKRPRVRQGGPMGNMGAGEKAKNFRGTMKNSHIIWRRFAGNC